MRRTPWACGPLGPCSTSNSTLAPSVSDLKPSLVTELKWTNTSLLPSLGVMKPNPFASLNHLTVPVAIEKHLLCLTHERAEEAHGARPVLARRQPNRITDPGLPEQARLAVSIRRRDDGSADRAKASVHARTW